MPNPDHPPPTQGWILPYPPSAPPMGSADFNGYEYEMMIWCNILKNIVSTPFLISSDFPGQPSTPTCLLPLMTSPCSDQPMSKRRLVIAMTAKYSLLLIRIFCPGWWGAHQRGLELFAQVSKIHHQVLIGKFKECKSSLYVTIQRIKTFSLFYKIPVENSIQRMKKCPFTLQNTTFFSNRMQNSYFCYKI